MARLYLLQVVLHHSIINRFFTGPSSTKVLRGGVMCGAVISKRQGRLGVWVDRASFLNIHRIHRRQHVTDDAGISKHRLSPYYAYYHNDSL